MRKNRKKKIAAGIAGMLLAAGVTVNEAFDPKALLQSKDTLARPRVQEQAQIAAEQSVVEESYERLTLADARQGSASLQMSLYGAIRPLGQNLSGGFVWRLGLTLTIPAL